MIIKKNMKNKTVYLILSKQNDKKNKNRKIK